MLANVLARGSGPRATGKDTVVAGVIAADLPVTAVSAVGPSSHGTENTK